MHFFFFAFVMFVQKVALAHSAIPSVQNKACIPVHSSKDCVLTRRKNELAGILHVITCNSVFYSGSQQDYCCFKERWSPNGLWSDRSYINRLFALSTDAIITNYFQALWELNNFVMHHWTFSCFDSRWFQGSICSQQCFQQAPFTFTKRFRNIRIFIPHHRCLSWSLPIRRHSGLHSRKDRGGFWNTWQSIVCRLLLSADEESSNIRK